MKAWYVVVAAFWCSAACSLSMGPGAKVSADGTMAVLTGTETVLIQVPQPPPELPEPPPPKPKRILKARVLGEKIEIVGRVVFEENKAAIKAESHPILSDVGVILSEHAEIKKVRIEGHTDEGGDDAHDKELSLQWATAVKEFLLASGIADSRLVAVGYGGERPRASNDSAEGREENKRVEFYILVREENSGAASVGQVPGKDGGAVSPENSAKKESTAKYKAAKSGQAR